MSTTSTTPTPATNPVASIPESTVLLTLSLGKPGNSRRVPKSQVDVKSAVQSPDPDTPEDTIDQGMLGVAKQLLESPEYLAITKLDGKIRQFVYQRILPGIFKAYLLPIGLFQEVDDALLAFQVERETLVTSFMDAYPQRCVEARAKLHALMYGPHKPRSEVQLLLGRMLTKRDTPLWFWL